MNENLKWAKTPGNYDSLNLALIYPSNNKYGIPNVPRIELEGFKPPKDLIAYGNKNKGSDNALHFFEDDYKFEPVWNRPIKTLDKVKKYEMVLSPDFSLFTNYPRVIQIWNIYRNRWCDCYWSEKGIKVIPTVTWGDKESFDFCFLGIPKHSVVAISGMGSKKKSTKEAYKLGFIEMLKVLEPKALIIYGGLNSELEEYINIPTFRYKTYWEKRAEETKKVLPLH